MRCDDCSVVRRWKAATMTNRARQGMQEATEDSKEEFNKSAWHKH
jgi:hypothetical protein